MITAALSSGTPRVENGAEAQATRLGGIFGGVPRSQAIRRARGCSTGRGGGGGWRGGGVDGGQVRAEAHRVREDARRDQRGEPAVDGARADKVWCGTSHLADADQIRADLIHSFMICSRSYWENS